MGNNCSRLFLPPTDAGTRPAPRQRRGAAGVSPASWDVPCSVLHARRASCRDNEEVGMRRDMASLTCAGWPLWQPRGHGVSLQRRLLRREEPGVRQRGGHQGLGH